MLPLVSHQDFLSTLAVGLTGAVLFNVLGLPAASLCGAMVGSACLLVMGRAVALPSPLKDGAFLVAGVGMGAAVTPEMLEGIARYPLSLAIFAVSLFVNMAASHALLTRWGGMNVPTAFLSVVPGALSTVMAVAGEVKSADTTRITLIQSVRLFALVTLLPSVIMGTGGLGVVAPPAVMGIAPLVLLLALGAAASFLLERVGFAAAWIFGGMLVSAVAHGSGLVKGGTPWLLNEIAFALVGIYIGIRFSGIRKAALLQSLGVAVAALLVGLGVALLAALLAAWLGLASFNAALVAYVPGALEAMIVLGAVLNLDPVYVGLHHLARFFGIGLLLPFVVPWLKRH